MERNSEEELLRVVALKNAQSVLLARQRAEDELLRAKEALELKTQELAHSLALMCATLESTPDGILATDEVGKVKAFNENYVKMWRIPREAMDSRDHRQLLDLTGRQFEDPAGFLAKIAAICASMPEETFDLLELADGRVFERFSRIQAVDGRNSGRVWIFRDVTERARMQKSESWLASLVESSNDAVISKSLDGIIQSWNPAAESLFGYTAEQAVGRHISLLIPAERADEEDHIVARLRAGERVEHFDTVRARSDGQTVQVSLTISPIRGQAGRIIGASKIARDVSERKRMEDELREHTVALAEADRRKNDFLAILAHELRNLLGPISTSVEMMRLEGANAQAVASASGMIQRQVGHIVRLVDDLYDVSRISRGKVELRKEPVELASLVANVVEAARPLTERMGHQLTITLPPESMFLLADSTRLAQVVGNLLNNACKFTNKGGRIWLTVEREREQAVIRVRDSGIGIAAEQLSRIFDMFMQLDTSLERSAGGLGIGLTLVKSFVEMHDGTVEVHSPGVGQGTEFVVRLPL